MLESKITSDRIGGFLKFSIYTLLLGAVSLGGDLFYPGGLYKPNGIFHSLPATIQLVSLLHGLPVESKGNTSQVVP